MSSSMEQYTATYDQLEQTKFWTPPFYDAWVEEAKPNYALTKTFVDPKKGHLLVYHGDPCFDDFVKLVEAQY